MNKYTGFSPKEIRLVRQGLLVSPGWPKKELREFLEVAKRDYEHMHGEKIEFYEECIDKTHAIMNEYPHVVCLIDIAKTKSYGTEKYLEYVFQLHPHGEWYISEEIEYLIKNVVIGIPEVG